MQTEKFIWTFSNDCFIFIPVLLLLHTIKGIRKGQPCMYCIHVESLVKILKLYFLLCRNYVFLIRLIAIYLLEHQQKLYEFVLKLSSHFTYSKCFWEGNCS